MLLAAGSDGLTIDEVNPVWVKKRCVSLVLNSTEITGDIAALTNADILKQILNVPLLLLAGLGESLTKLPMDWRLMLDSTRER